VKTTFRRASIAILSAASALAPRAAPAQTVAVERVEAKNEPNPKREIVWTNVEAGLQSVRLQTFSANLDSFTGGIFPTSATGPMLGFGAGFRVVFLTLGARARVTMFNDDAPEQRLGNWQLWTLDGEIGLRAPLGRLEPYFNASGGYATFGGLSRAVAGIGDGLNVHGVDARAAFGFDYYVTKHVSLGLQISGDLLFIARDGVSVANLAAAKQIGTLNEAKARVLEASGTTVGSAWALTGGVGLHF